MIQTAREIRETGRQYALRIIRSRIVHLKLEPGSWISENELAASLDLSRTPVREALQELSAVRLVEIYPQRGSRVSLIDYALVEEARFLRLALERAVAELLCGSLSEEGRRRLEDNLRHQDLYIAQEDPSDFFQADNEFHHLLFQEARKEISYDMMNSMTAHFDRVRHMAAKTGENRSRNRDDHAELLEAILCGDTKKADRTVLRHLSYVQLDEKELRSLYPPAYFAKT